MSSEDGYAIALRDASGPARRAFRVAERYADLGTQGTGISVEITATANVQSAADELLVCAPQLLTNRGLAIGDTVRAWREPECTSRRGFGLVIFASLWIQRWGLPCADIVLADPDGLALAHSGPFASGLVATREMRLRVLFVIVANGVDPPQWLVDAVVPDCGAALRRF